jgi:hypothetical protein
MQETKMHLRRLAFWILMLLMTFPAGAQDSVVLDILDHVNQARIQAGVPVVALNDALIQAAQRHSNDMALTGSLLHTGSDKSEFWERMRDAGYILTGRRGKYTCQCQCRCRKYLRTVE